MRIPEDLRSPVNKALYRLSMGDMTCGEMLAYLSDPRRKNTGFSTEIAERVVSFLVENALLDDKRYLRLAVEKLDNALVGPRKIREKLVQHRFPPRYVEAALARNVDYTRRAFKLLTKRAGASAQVKTPAGKKKLMDYLVRQGYDYSTATGAVNRFAEAEDASD